MIKAVIFDLDGTLLDRDRSLIDYAEKQYDRTPAFHHATKDEFVRRFIALDQKGYVWKDKVYQALIEEFGASASCEQLLDEYLEQFQHHCVGFANLFEMLDDLKGRGLKLGMITNGRDPFQANNMRALGIEHYFDSILISEREGMRKPEPDIFHRALLQLNVQPHESIYVGDHPDNDVRASQRVGLRAIWKEDAYYDAPAEADWVITDLIEITGIVDELSS